MSILQGVKKAVDQVTGAARPGRNEALGLTRPRKPNEFKFRDDGLVPNHPSWPLVVYCGAVRLPKEFDPAAVVEELFGANGWGNSWRDGIYDYVHYHSQIHEVLGVARGTAQVQFGGKKGRTLSLKAGDVAVLPAGTGHQCLVASSDFLAVGAYPPFGTYDECTTVAQHDAALTSIRKLGRPRKDPVYGSRGPLVQSWKQG